MPLRRPSPEERIAAAARALQLHYEPESKVPDIADYRDGLRVYVRRELILARIDEARQISGTVLTERIRVLAAELAKCEMEMLPEDKS
jgi:hypothetical protein